MIGPARIRRGYRLAAVVLMLAIAGCVNAPPTQRPGPHPSPVPETPPDTANVADPVPRAEPRSRKGNPPFYTVFGKRYYVLPDATGYLERGVASWYGPGFHRANTANGERYDMYAMTAAHKTLPLPAYVLVTNLRNGRSVTVRVNDRGPFKDTRIIDLSYTAAVKLDMVRDGTAFVEVRALKPSQASNQIPNQTPSTAAPPAAATPQLFVQAGAFASEANASRLVAQLQAQGISKAFVRRDQVNGAPLFRVRVGPVPSVPEFDKALAQLKSLGLTDARLAND